MFNALHQIDVFFINYNWEITNLIWNQPWYIEVWQKKDENKLIAVEMRFLGRIYGKTMYDNVKKYEDPERMQGGSNYTE